MTDSPYGFRVVGHWAGERRLVDHAAAFAAHAGCDYRADPQKEAYLSLYVFSGAFRNYLTETRSTKGYDGPCGAPWIWWDIDRPSHLDQALGDARRLVGSILDRHRDLDEDDMLVFFSGAKGVHVGMPITWSIEASSHFNFVARRFALRTAETAEVVVDPAVYDKQRLFRAPNSRHPATGLHKRRLAHEELMYLRAEAITRLATQPEPFDVPRPMASGTTARDDWLDAGRTSEEQFERHLGFAAGAPDLNRATLDFIRAGAPRGERAVRLFRAAANLAEFGCPAELAHALLTDAALDCGLPPAETRRQIDCGLAHVLKVTRGGAA